jgi:hypothetical protein
MKAKEIIDEGALGSIGKALQKVGGSMVAKSAAKVAEPAVEKGSGIAGKAFKVGKALATNPIKTAIGYNILTDPDKFNNSIPTTIGNAIGNTYRQGKQLAGAAWDAATRDDDTAVVSTPGAKTSPQQSAKPSAAAAEKEFDHGNDQPSAAPEPESDSYVQDMERRIQKNFNSWPGEQNESVKKKSAITEKEKEDPLAAIQRGIYGQESGSGKAKTDRPNYAGAMGPMQIMPGTFDWIKTLKLIPQDYDIKNPKHNKEAGNALIAHYYKKYNGDTAKVAAAYYGGPGAINKDGTINTQWRDKKNPKAPTVGQYIDQTLAKANLPATGATVALAGVPKGGGAKPSTTLPTVDIVKPLSGPSGEKLVQMPDFSQGFKSGDKFIPQTKQGYGEPVDYKQAYTTSKQSMGLSRDEAMKLAAAERQATQSNQPYDEPAALKAIREPALKTLATVATPAPGTKDDKQTGSWDKVKTTNAPLEEQDRITESINKEIQDILRLSGKR